MVDLCARAIKEWCSDGGARARRRSAAMAWRAAASLGHGEGERGRARQVRASEEGGHVATVLLPTSA